MPAQDYLSVKEAAKLVGVSGKTLRRWDKEGVIESTKTVGGHRRFFLPDIENLLGHKYQHLGHPISNNHFMIVLISFLLVSSLLIFIAKGNETISKKGLANTQTQKEEQVLGGGYVSPEISNQVLSSINLIPSDLNLLFNSSFEAGVNGFAPRGWSYILNSSLGNTKVSTESTRTGNLSLKFDGASSPALGISQPNTTTINGRKYIFSVNIRSFNLVGNPTLRFGFIGTASTLDPNYGKAGFTAYAADKFTDVALGGDDKKDWTTFSFEYDNAALGKYPFIQISNYQGGKIFLEDLSLYEVIQDPVIASSGDSVLGANTSSILNSYIVYQNISRIGDGSITVDATGAIYPTLWTGQGGTLGRSDSRFGSIYIGTIDASSDASIGGNLTLSGSATISGDLAINGDDITSDSNLSIDANGYLRIGDSGTPGSANGDDDLYVQGDLEVDGTIYGNIASDTSLNGVTTLSSMSNITDVFVYDTSKDTDGGIWRNDERGKASSWYNETIDNTGSACVLDTDDRCGTREFPAKATIVATTTKLYIYDSQNNTLWMDFRKGSATTEQMIGPTTNSTGQSLWALNGKIYYGNRGSVGGLYVIDLINDRSLKYNSTDDYIGDKTIANRNSTVTFVSGPSSPIADTYIFDIHAKVIGNKTYVATGTDGGMSVINETDNTVYDYSETGPDFYSAVWLDRYGNLWALNSSEGNLEKWSDVVNDTADKSPATPNFEWDSTSTPALAESAFSMYDNSPSALFVTDGTSIVDDKSQTVYAGHDLGLSVLNMKEGDEANSSVKYYTSNYISEELIGNVLGMWPLQADDTAADFEDISVKTNNLTSTGIDSSDSASGVRSTATDFDGSTEYLSIPTASANDLNFQNSDPNDKFSFSAWVYPTTMAGSSEEDGIITRWDQTSLARQYRLVLTNDDADTTGNFKIDLYDESADQTLTASSPSDSVSENTWYHVVATYNGSAEGVAGDLKIYIDGVLAAQNSANSSFFSLDTVSTDFVIGSYDATDAVATNTGFTGRIDEAMITGEELTSDQVKHIYQVGHRALQNHTASRITGVTGADNYQRLMGNAAGGTSGTWRLSGVAVDDSNQFLFAGLKDTSGNTGGVTVIGIDSDSAVDLYDSTANTSKDDNSGTQFSANDVAALSLSGSHCPAYNSGSSVCNNSAVLAIAGTNDTSTRVWMETSGVSLYNALAQVQGANITKDTVTAEKIVDKSDSSYFLDPANTETSLSVAGTVSLADVVTGANSKDQRVLGTSNSYNDSNSVFVYDSSKDTDGGIWRNDDRAKASSWYNETIDHTGTACTISSDDRCGKREFPTKAIIANTITNVYIFDAADNTLWMKFNQGTVSEQMIGSSQFLTSAFALNGKIYLSDGGGTTVGSLYVIDFVNDRAYRYDEVDDYVGDKNIANRNSSITWWAGPSGPVVDDYAEDVFAAVVNGKTFIALATADGLSVINETDRVVYDYSDVSLNGYGKVWIDREGNLWGWNWSLGQLEKWKSVVTDTADEAGGTPDNVWDETTIPSIWWGSPNGNTAPDSLFLKDGTSTVDGKSPTVYLAFDNGAVALNTKAGDETNGSVKYYLQNGNSTTDEMIGDIRGMWPLEADNVNSDGDDWSDANTDLSLNSIDSTNSADGVRSTSTNFNGSDEWYSRSAASDANVDFNGTENFTLSAWVYPTTMAGAGDFDAIIAKWDETTADSRGYRLVLTNDDADTTGNFRAEVYSDSGQSETITASSATDSVQENKWYHVVMTFNGGTAGAAGDLKLYVDGIFATQNNANATFNGLDDVAADFTVGNYDFTDAVATNTGVTGRIDEAMATAEVLTAGQIDRIASVGRRASQNHVANRLPGVSANNYQRWLGGGQGGLTDSFYPYAMAVDDSNQYLYIGINSQAFGNTGGVTVFGLDSDSAVDYYHSANTSKATDDGIGFGYNSIESISVSGTPCHPYNGGTSTCNNNGTLAIFTSDDIVNALWMESSQVSLNDALSLIGSSDLMKNDITVNNLFTIYNTYNTLTQATTGEEIQTPAFQVDSNGNMVYNYLGTSTTATGLDFNDSVLTSGTLLDLTSTTINTGDTLKITANALTSGNALDISSTATAFTGDLANITLSGSNAANTGTLLTLTNSGVDNTGTSFYIKHYATGTNNLAMRVDDESGDTTPFVIDGAGNVGIGSTTPAEELDIEGQIQFDLDGTTDTTIGVCKDVADGAGVEDNVEFADCSSTPGDIAEYYRAQSNLLPGDVVSYKNINGVPTLVRSDSSYDSKLFGIVSTFPVGQFGKPLAHDTLEANEFPTAIALTGKVPTLVSTEGGIIEVGDPLTSSSSPGVAMKATNSGKIIGYALENFDGSTLVSGDVRKQEEYRQNSIMKFNSDPVDPSGDGIGKIMVSANTGWFFGALTAQGEIENTISEVSLTTQETVLGTDTSLLEQDLNSLKSIVETLQGDVSLLKSVQLVEGTASPSSQIESSLPSLSVLGETILGDTTITGNLGVGVITFNGLEGSVDAIGPLKLQSLALDSIELAGNSVEIDKNGNLLIKEGVLSGNQSFRDFVVLEAGQTSADIQRDWQEKPVSIQLTPSYDTRVWVTNISETGFTINVASSPESEEKIYWFALW